jgi:hypothetical protein
VDALSVQPIDLPGRNLFDETIPVSVAPSALTLMRDNEFAFEVFHSEHPLPAPTVVPRADGLFVTVADADDLGQWLTALGGEIHQSPVFEGLTVWSLHTTLPRSGNRSVPLRVSVAVLADEPLMSFIRAAVVTS